MILNDFDYFKPATLAEALSLLKANPGRCSLLGGGSDLIVRLKQARAAPQIVVDLKGLELCGLTFDASGAFKIGTAVTLRDLEASPEVKKCFPALYEAVAHMASTQIRSRATIGGNLCNAAPSADTAPPLLVYGATLVAERIDGEKVVARRFPIEDFFTGPGMNSLQASEILTQILLPPPPARTGSTYLKLRRTEKDIAIVGAAALLTLDRGDKCTDVKIALGAVAPTPVRARAAEVLLLGRPVTDELICMAAKAAILDAKPIDDFRASARYRRDMVLELTKRALRTAFYQAKSSFEGGL